MLKIFSCIKSIFPLPTTRISSFKYVFIVIFEKKQVLNYTLTLKYSQGKTTFQHLNTIKRINELIKKSMGDLICKLSCIQGPLFLEFNSKIKLGDKLI